MRKSLCFKYPTLSDMAPMCTMDCAYVNVNTDTVAILAWTELDVHACRFLY